jgi:hypothetical protein
MINFVHLFPRQLGMNGERGNLDCLQSRLRWAGLDSQIHDVSAGDDIPESVDAVFIGSGTLSGALEALELMRPLKQRLTELASSGFPFLALGLGWEILGQEIQLLDDSTVPGLGIYPSKSKRVNVHASCEAFGFDQLGNLTAGYANHSSEISLLDGSQPLVSLLKGFGNSSTTAAPKSSAEGLASKNLIAARLNGPLLPLNPHFADGFLAKMSSQSGFVYDQQSLEAQEVDELSMNARKAIQQRLLRK